MLSHLDIIGAAILIMLLLVLWHLSRVQKQLTNHFRIEAKLDLLLQHSGLTYDPLALTPSAVTEALDRGDRIAAIRAYRIATGAELREAKEFVEAVISRRTPS